MVANLLLIDRRYKQIRLLKICQDTGFQSLSILNQNAVIEATAVARCAHLIGARMRTVFSANLT